MGTGFRQPWPMTLIVAFGLMASLIGVVTWEGWLWWPLGVWWVLGACWVALACVPGWVGLWGKKSDGRRRLWTSLVLAPYLVLAWFLWRLLVVWLGGAPSHRLVRQIWIGRRPVQSEIPDEVRVVLDLTAEFSVPAWLRQRCHVISLPVTDGTPPDLQGWVRAWEALQQQEGGCLVHCAQGRGRTGLIASLILLELGEAEDASAALQMVKACRPGVRLRPEQWLFLVRFDERRKGSKR